MSRNPAFSNVLYVTAASTDRWFIPVNSDVHGQGGTADPTMAQQLAECQKMLGTDSGNSDAQLGKAVQAGSLADW